MKMVFIIGMKRLVVCLAAACSSSTPAPPDAPSTLANASDVPIDGLSAADVASFQDGDALFDLPFRPIDGLGPLYVRTSCGACHDKGSRGPGLVQKMAVVADDGVTAAANQSELAFGHTIKEGLTAGATTPITAPADPHIKLSVRLGPAVLGRGYLEAVADSELERVEAEQGARTDGIHGRIARVIFVSQPNPDPTFEHYQMGDPVIGRFGVKARQPTLDDFTADALQGDMGLTTPMRPAEAPNPDGLTDDMHPGVDLPQDHIDRIAFYVRRTAIPRRDLPDGGAELFAQTGCATCHAPTMHTRADYPIQQLADIDAPIYTDLLLHDMGPALADGMTDGNATSVEWRTAPLIGLRFARSYLHDGRAQSVEDAITAHAGQATASAAAFAQLSPADHQLLLDFVNAL
jgi:CxxC motif-containing protein (DUF1111 family)